MTPDEAGYPEGLQSNSLDEERAKPFLERLLIHSFTVPPVKGGKQRFATFLDHPSAITRTTDPRFRYRKASRRICVNLA